MIHVLSVTSMKGSLSKVLKSNLWWNSTNFFLVGVGIKAQRTASINTRCRPGLDGQIMGLFKGPWPLNLSKRRE